MKKTTLLTITLFWVSLITAQNWVQRASYSGQGRVNPVTFSIGGKGYVATGSSTDTPNSIKFSDVWEYDTSNNSWSQKASIPGIGRTGAIGESFQNSGYVGLGWDGTNMFKDIRKFDPVNNSWVLETTYPGLGSRNCFSLVNDSNLYIAGGSNLNNIVSDFWRYDLISKNWTQLPIFVLGNRQGGICFSIDSILFFGMGYNGTTNLNDLWGYNVNSGLWSQYNSFPGIGRIQSSVNIIGRNKVIIGGGHQIGVGGSLSDYYEFDYLNNSWRIINGFIAGSRSTADGFTIGNRAFVSSGRDSLGFSLNDLWEVTGLLTLNEKLNNQPELSFYPNPVKDFLNIDFNSSIHHSLRIYNNTGKIVFESFSNSNNNSLDISDLDNGVYYLTLLEGSNRIISKAFIKSK